jgi:hypothetical protein
MDVLIGYCHLMRQRDVIGNAFKKTEENHRDKHLGHDSREPCHSASG